MNKFLIICSLIAVASCSSKKGDADIESNVMLEEPVMKVEDGDGGGKHEGLALIEKSDCLTCHQVETKVVGPSYLEVAEKYTEGDMDMLADKIINGGKGNWGEIPMSAHAGMSKDNAKKMVAYILTLKK